MKHPCAAPSPSISHLLMRKVWSKTLPAADFLSAMTFYFLDVYLVREGILCYTLSCVFILFSAGSLYKDPALKRSFVFMNSANEIWMSITPVLQEKFTEIAFKTWFGQVEALDFKMDKLTLSCTSDFKAKMIRDRFLSDI